MIAPGETAESTSAQNETLDMLRVAENLESESPLWIVVFGIYSRQFVAFPRFDTPTGTMAVARYPGALAERMRRIERMYLRDL